MTRTEENLLTDIHNVTDVYTDKHFVYTSGKHGDGYVNYRNLGAAENVLLLRETVAHLLRRTLEPVNVRQYRNIVAVGPETMGAKMVRQIPLLTEAELSYNIDTRILKKDPDRTGEFVWDADPERVLHEDTLVLWLDDLLNQTSTFRKTAPMVYFYGAQIHSVATIGDRSSVSPHDLAVRQIVCCEKFRLAVYDQGDCLECRNAQPVVTDLGHGNQWRQLNQSYVGGFTTVR